MGLCLETILNPLQIFGMGKIIGYGILEYNKISVAEMKRVERNKYILIST
jgi:hypothetical protein